MAKSYDSADKTVEKHEKPRGGKGGKEKGAEAGGKGPLKGPKPHLGPGITGKKW